MAENDLLLLLFAVIDLLKGAFLVSIPAFAFVFIAVLVRKALAKKYKWNWFSSSLVTTYFLVFSMTLVLYITPYFDATAGLAPQVVPPELQQTPAEFFAPFAAQFARLLIVALLLALLLMPIEFIGLFLFEKISERLHFAYSIRLFLATFLVSLFCSFIIIFVAPWIITGILYLIFFGGT